MRIMGMDLRVVRDTKPYLKNTPLYPGGGYPPKPYHTRGHSTVPSVYIAYRMIRIRFLSWMSG